MLFLVNPNMIEVCFEIRLEGSLEEEVCGVNLQTFQEELSKNLPSLSITSSSNLQTPPPVTVGQCFATQREWSTL